MKTKLASAWLASLIVIIVLPGSCLAPVALAMNEAALLPSAPGRFVASLPINNPARAPAKVVALNGRESLGLKVVATHAYVQDQVSGSVLFAKNEHEQLPLASITKLMTACVLRVRGLDWNARVTVTNVNDGGGTSYFLPGDVVTVRDLWQAMLIGSSNTAATTLVAQSGLSLESFVAQMNTQAAALGMTRTHFFDPVGLSPNNVSTAYDVAILVKAVFVDSEIAATTVLPSFKMTTAKGVVRTILSTDKLLNSFVNKPPYRIIGGKTGYITESGYNLALSIEHVGAAPVVVVVMGSSSDASRFQDAKGLAYWAFTNYRWDGSLAAVTE